MRFIKGMKVEVLSKKEVPSGSWHCAEIINGNGHSYTVRYERYSGATDEMITERVSRKAIRPCPPWLVVSDNWFLGDVVEVFVNYSWKTATVLRVVEKKYVLVRLLGSSLELKVCELNIRVRQSWQDNEWVVIRNGFDSCEDWDHGKIPTPRNNHNSSSQLRNNVRRRNQRTEGARWLINNKVNSQESVIASSKTLKRGCYSQVEAHVGSGHKLSKVEKEGRLYRLVAIAANPSIINNRTGLSETHTDRRKANGVVGCYFADKLESNDVDSVTCSIGSCSAGSNNLCRLSHCVSKFPVEEVGSQCSEAAPFYPRGGEEGNCILPTKEELDAEIHKIELHAYRRTIEALHALGPLSWEQEALVTNLRRSLHISNDEHLMELRNLISAETNISIR